MHLSTPKQGARIGSTAHLFMPTNERRERRQAWPFGGRQNTPDAWVNAGRETFGSFWNVLISQQALHPESLRGIGGYGDYLHAPEIHPLVWIKPDVMSRFTGKSKALVAVMAPSAGGKDTILRRIRSDHPALVDIVVTHTTKQPRADDTPGETYHFVNDAEFERLAQEGGLAEYVPQFGRRYGTSFEALRKSLDAPQTITVWRGEPVGWNTLQFELARQFPDMPYASCFILPKVSVFTLTEWILNKRRNEFPIPRIQKAITEIYAGGAMDVCVVNPYQEKGPVEATEALLRFFTKVQEGQLT